MCRNKVYLGEQNLHSNMSLTVNPLIIVVLHFRDFATRNCMLASDLSVKVGDYGISEEKFKVCQSYDIGFFAKAKIFTEF